MIIVKSVKFPEATAMARKDFAEVRGFQKYEPPYWFEDTETGTAYKGLYGCLAWPGKVQDNNDQPLGYAAIVGVEKADTDKYLILDETEDPAPEMLVEKSLFMRKKWGFGTHSDLINVFYGDHLRFELLVAYINNKLIKGTDNSKIFTLIPPDDFENPKSFDVYFRRLQYLASPDNKKLWFGQANIVRRRLELFKREEPAVIALGGLLHSLLNQRPWEARTKHDLLELQFDEL